MTTNITKSNTNVNTSNTSNRTHVYLNTNSLTSSSYKSTCTIKKNQCKYQSINCTNTGNTARGWPTILIYGNKGTIKTTAIHTNTHFTKNKNRKNNTTATNQISKNKKNKRKTNKHHKHNKNNKYHKYNNHNYNNNNNIILSSVSKKQRLSMTTPPPPLDNLIDYSTYGIRKLKRKSKQKRHDLSMECPSYMKDVFGLIAQFGTLGDIIVLNKINKEWFKFTCLFNTKVIRDEDENNSSKLTIGRSINTVGCNLYQSIIFHMFCNLDVMYRNPIQSGTNLLHSKWHKSEWFSSFKHFNQNLLLLACDNFNKYTFVNDAFPYIAQKCCQFMINLNVCKQYHIIPFNEEYNFFHSPNEIQKREEFFDNSAKNSLMFINDIVREYDKCTQESKHFSDKSFNVVYFCKFYFYVESLIDDLKRSTKLHPELQNEDQYRTNDRSVPFAKLFDCFNFWNVICNSCQCDEKQSSSIGNVLFCLNNVDLFKKRNDISVHSLFVCESVLKLLIVSFGDDLDDGKQTIERPNKQRNVYTWHEFMCCLSIHTQIHLRRFNYPFDIQSWTRQPGILESENWFDKIDDKYEFGYEIMCSRSLIRNILFDRTKQTSHNIIGLFHNGIITTMEISSNQRIGDPKMGNQHKVIPGDDGSDIENRRSGAFTESILGFAQNRLRIKSLIICEQEYINNHMQRIYPNLVHPNWKEYSSIIYKTNVVKEIYDLRTMENIVEYTINRRKYLNYVENPATAEQHNGTWFYEFLTLDSWYDARHKFAK